MKMTIVLCFSQQCLIVLFHTIFGDDAAEIPVLFHPFAGASPRLIKPNEVAELFCSVCIVIIEHGIIVSFWSSVMSIAIKQALNSDV